MEYKDEETGKKYSISYSQELQQKAIQQKWVSIALQFIIVILLGIIAWSGVLTKAGQLLFCGG